MESLVKLSSLWWFPFIFCECCNLNGIWLFIAYQAMREERTKVGRKKRYHSEVSWSEKVFTRKRKLLITTAYQIRSLWYLLLFFFYQFIMLFNVPCELLYLLFFLPTPTIDFKVQPLCYQKCVKWLKLVIFCDSWVRLSF